MKWLASIFLLGWMVFPVQVSGPHFIGRHKAEVKELMKQERKDLHVDDLSVNRVYNILKYIDRTGDQTLLFVFSKQDTCLYSKWMCDYSMLNAVMADLNSKYSQSAEDTWTYIHEGVPYIITLTAGDWYFTITTRKEQKKTGD
jgi:hypothetical protein